MSENFERRFQPQHPDIDHQPDEQNSSTSQTPQESNSLKEASPRQRLFTAACNERLDELVELGMLPKRFAEERRKNAALIEEGFSDNPEVDGQSFAEIGTEGVGALQRGIDEVDKKITSQLQPYLDLTESLITDLEQENAKSGKIDKLKDLSSQIKSSLDELRDTLEKVKKLDVPFSDLNQQVIAVEKSLENLQVERDSK